MEIKNEISVYITHCEGLSFIKDKVYNEVSEANQRSPDYKTLNIAETSEGYVITMNFIEQLER